MPPEAKRARLAIIAAMEREVRPLVRNWSSRLAREGHRTFRFFESEPAVLVCAGIGREAARAATEAVITRYKPRAIVSAGFAGALVSGLGVGSIFAPQRVIDSADGTSFEIGLGDGILVSVNSVLDPQQKARLATEYHAQAVDMEAAGVAHVADDHGIKFLAVKAISDSSSFAMPHLKRFIDADGAFHTGKFLLHVAIRPWTWPAVASLAYNSSRAATALSRWLRQLELEAGNTGPSAAAPPGGAVVA